MYRNVLTVFLIPLLSACHILTTYSNSICLNHEFDVPNIEGMYQSVDDAIKITKSLNGTYLVHQWGLDHEDTELRFCKLKASKLAAKKLYVEFRLDPNGYFLAEVKLKKNKFVLSSLIVNDEKVESKGAGYISTDESEGRDWIIDNSEINVYELFLILSKTKTIDKVVYYRAK